MPSRWLPNLFTTPLALRRCFPSESLDAIAASIRTSEQAHRAEIRVAIEAALPIAELWRGRTARERAHAVFAELGVWDTAENNGILLYVLLAERDIEIVADRGFAGLVTSDEWETVCREMEVALRKGEFEGGCVGAIRALTALAGRHFPGTPRDRDELPDRPALL